MRLGTRRSALALAQAELVAAMLGDVEIVPLATGGDAGAGPDDKSRWVDGLERALLAGEIDLAVHSAKDLPIDLAPGLELLGAPARAGAEDVLCGTGALAELPAGARVGTSSLRRIAQLRSARPDLEVAPVRGNVDTRLAKLEAGEADAIILAMAGLKRLGLQVVGTPIDPIEQPPAPGQGALAIQVRAEDAQAPWLAALIHRPSLIAVAAERGALAALEGSCKTAIGAHAQLQGESLKLIVEALTPDGRQRFRREGEADVGGDRGEAAARALGVQLGEAVRDEGGAALEL